MPVWQHVQLRTPRVGVAPRRSLTCPRLSPSTATWTSLDLAVGYSTDGSTDYWKVVRVWRETSLWSPCRWLWHRRQFGKLEVASVTVCDHILLVAQRQKWFWRVRSSFWSTLLPSGKWRAVAGGFLGVQCGTCKRRVRKTQIGVPSLSEAQK